MALLPEMPGRMLRSDAIIYSASISACEKGSQWVQALALLREMTDRRLETNVFSYSASISACEWDMLWGCIASFGASIRALEKCLPWVLALALFQEMPGRWIQPGVASCSAALCVCEKGLLWVQALWLLREMLQQKIDSHFDIHRLVCATNLLH